jgi:GNAT superfamily N-acetyltransferase
MEGDHFMLKYRDDATKIIDFLLSHEWETRPGMDIGWIIRSIDELYILTDFRNVDCYIGFMIYNEEKGNLWYFEILPQYQNKGYAKNIIEHLEIKKIYGVKKESKEESFWAHVAELADIVYD